MNQPSRLHVVMLFISIVLVAFSAAVYLYLFHETSALTDQAVAARGIVQAEESNQAEGKNLLLLYQTTNASRARLRSFFVPADAAVDFIQTIESIGASSGASVSISSISEDQPPSSKPGSIGSVAAHVSVSGSWTDVIKTLSLFEDLPYQSYIDHVAVYASAITGTKAHPERVWQMSFDVSASTLIEPAVAPAASSTQTQS